MNSQCIFISSGDIIKNKFGLDAYNMYVSKLHGKSIQLGSTAGYPAVVQVKIINNFWRSILSTIPDTTDIRSWLVSSETVSGYLFEFKNNWLKDIISKGVLSDEQ